MRVPVQYVPAHAGSAPVRGFLQALVGGASHAVEVRLFAERTSSPSGAGTLTEVPTDSGGVVRPYLLEQVRGP